MNQTLHHAGELRGKVAIVTGAGQGLGADIAAAFADEGARLVLVELDPGRLQNRSNDFDQRGVEVAAVAGDVADQWIAEKAIAVAMRDFGAIDILVNCAQRLSRPVPLIEQRSSHFEAMIGSGLYGTVNFMQAAYPALKERAGSIINIGSGAGILGSVGQASYAAAKEAIRAVSRVAAREWGRDGVRVNVICPAAVSPSMESWFEGRPDELKAALSATAMGSFAHGYDDVGRLAVFLAGPRCSLTGQTLQIDGGQIMI